MAQFSVNIKQTITQVERMKGLERELESCEGSIRKIRKNLNSGIASNRGICRGLDSSIKQVKTARENMKSMQKSLSEILSWYEKTESRITDHSKKVLKEKLSEISTSRAAEINYSGFRDYIGDKAEKFVEEFQLEYDWSDLLKGSNYISTIYNYINRIKNKKWYDIAKTGFDIYYFAKNAAKTFSNYRKIGNAVGIKKAMTWWGKNITGLRPIGRASAAKNPFNRFVNNLTNKTSPYNAKIKNTIGNFKGANGVGKAIASWGTVAVTGVMNWFSNKDEQAKSNGTMSDERVIAETVSETIIDTTLTITTDIVVGAAVTTALGTVAAPAVVVVALSGLVVSGLNAGVRALTGKTATEWISDTILDAGEAIGKAVGNVAKRVSNSIGSWFRKLSFA